MTLAADEFMRRFLLHVLPTGFHRIRHFGLIANAGCRENLARARQLLHVVPEGTEAPAGAAPPVFVCPDCGAAMIVIDTWGRGQPIRAPPHHRNAA
jgi:Putative transposase